MARANITQTYFDQRKNVRLFLHHLCFARSGTIASIPIAFIIFVMFCGSSWLFFWHVTDPARYQCYALTFWFGGDALHLLPPTQCSFLTTVIDKPMQMLPTEYPPLTLLIFSLPLLLPVAYYQFTFALLMSFIAVIIYWLLQRYGPRGSAFLFALYLLASALALAQVRYDLLPALCTLVCIIAAERKHWTIAYCMLALGILFKIYPLLLLPALVIAEQQDYGRLHIPASSMKIQTIASELWQALKSMIRWRWWNCMLCLGLVGGITGVFVSINLHDAVLSQLEYMQQRPIHTESMGGTVLWLANQLGVPWQGFRYNFGSINIISSLGQMLAQISTLSLLAGIIVIFWLQWRGKMDLAQTAVALIMLFIATGKVFSPQYLIWLLPLLVYTKVFDSFWHILWGTISTLTGLHYIFIYSQLPSPLADTTPETLPGGFFEIISIRNVLFAFMTIAYLSNWFQARQRQPVQRPQATLTPTKGTAEQASLS